MLIKRLTLTLILGVCTLTASLAQDSLLLRDYAFVRRSDPWLNGSNAAALTRFAHGNIAAAELSLTKGKGGFTDYYDAPDALLADAGVESYCRLSSRAVVYGAMSYNNFTGRDMAGSAFIPGRHLPFDIVEDSLTNTGTKHRDTYRLSGGVGYSVAGGIAIGARLDYNAANYAKYKDLRHKNKLMDMMLSAGLYLPLGTAVQIGANYLYRRTTESLQFSTYGKNDRTYMSFINYGPYIGTVEQFGSNGYTDKSRAMPLVDDINGIAAQIGAQLSAFSLYNAFTYMRRQGYYGRRSPYTITYTNHRSHIYDYAASLAMQMPTAMVRLDLSLHAENLENDARNYSEQKNDAGATYYQYYTPVKVADRLWADGAAAITADLGISDMLPSWTLQAGLRWEHRKQTAYLYPYYRRQRLTSREPFVSISHNRVSAHGVWTFAADAAFRKGDGAPYEDNTFAEPSDKATPPPTMDAYMMREYLWLTASQYCVGGSVKYSVPLPQLKMKAYVKGSATHRKCNATDNYLTGRDRTTVSIAVGCEH